MKLVRYLLATLAAGLSLAASLPEHSTDNVRLATPDEIHAQVVMTTPFTEANTTAPLDARGIEKRADHGVYLCVDKDFKGYCVHIDAPGNVCVPLGLDLEDRVSAVGPDRGAYCRFFMARGCSGAEGSFDTYYPGQPFVGKTYNDKISSYICWDS